VKQKIKSIGDKIDSVALKTQKDIEDFRVQMLGRKGEITTLFKEIKNLPIEEKRQ